MIKMILNKRIGEVAIWKWLILIISLAYCIKEAFGNGDFKTFLLASELVLNGQNPYDRWIHVTGDNYALYFYSPLWTMLLAPFTYLPWFVPKITWLLLNLVFTYRIINLLLRYLDGRIDKSQRQWITIISIGMSIRFILYNFGMIQMTLFLLWGILECLYQTKKQRFALSGFILALVINIKVMPLVILPYLIYRAKWKTVGNTILFSVVMLLLPALQVGWSKNLFLLNEWWDVINPINREHLIETELGPQSLTALIPTLLTATEGVLPLSRNVVDIDQNLAVLVLNVIRVSLIAFTLYFLRWPPFKSEMSSVLNLRELAYLCLLIPLIFPHQQSYAFALILPATIYLGHYLICAPNRFRSRSRYSIVLVLVVVSFILMTMTTDGIIGKEFNHIAKHFRLITWGALFLIPALAIANPITTVEREIK